MYRREIKILIIISFVLIGSLFFIQETKALDEANPSFEFGCHVGGAEEKCEQAFSFFGQAIGQVYAVDYQNLQNDRPVPKVELCFNNTATWGNGACRTVQEDPIQKRTGFYEIDNVNTNTLDYKYLVIRIFVRGELTNDNDFNGLWTMHRRVVEIKSFFPSSQDVQTGGQFIVNWETDQAIKGVTLEWDGPVQGGSGSKTVGASGPETFICSGNGVVELTLTALGPGENGEISPSKTRSVNCGSSNSYTLTVSTSGGGHGKVTGPGISCGSASSLGTDCSETYTSGASVTLSVQAEPGSDFREWSGDCSSSSSTCSLTMNSSKNVTATFNCFNCTPPPPPPPAGGDCSPKNQTVSVDQRVAINVDFGFAPYSWSAPGADPSSDNDAEFNTFYHSPGSYTATVTDTGGTFQCFVNVTGVQPPPPQPPPPQTRYSCNGSACVEDPNGSYTNPSCDSRCSAPKKLEICPDGRHPSSGCPDSVIINPGQSIQLRAWFNYFGDTGWRDETNASGWTLCNVDKNGDLPDYCRGVARFDGPKGRFRGLNSGGPLSVNASTGGEGDQVGLSVVLAPQPPTVSNVTVTEPNYCLSGPAATVNWAYSGGNPQGAYQVQVDTEGSSFNLPVADSGKISCENCRSYSTIQGLLQFGVTYKARVRAWDNRDTASDWVFSGTWRTPSHAYPQVNFTFSPSPVNVGSPTQFTDQTVFYDSNPNRRRWNWNFGDGRSAVQQNPSHTYDTAGNFNATLTATDGSGQSCSASKPLNTQTGSPIWKEVNPGG